MKFCGGSQTISIKMAQELGGKFEVMLVRINFKLLNALPKLCGRRSKGKEPFFCLNIDIQILLTDPCTFL